MSSRSLPLDLLPAVNFKPRRNNSKSRNKQRNCSDCAQKTPSKKSIMCPINPGEMAAVMTKSFGMLAKAKTVMFCHLFAADMSKH